MNKVKINKMPDKETLEAYVLGKFSEVKVYFDIDKGEFKWSTQKSLTFDKKKTNN